MMRRILGLLANPQLIALVGVLLCFGALNIAVRDCAGAPLGGVTIDVSPAPELLRNQANDGTLAAGGTTSDRFATVFGLNAAAGTTTITASADGYTFRPLTVAVTADLYNTLAILHADP